MKSSGSTKVNIVIDSQVWEESDRTMLQGGEMLLRLRVSPLDQCARKWMFRVGVPKPKMSSDECAEFNQRQLAAVAGAIRCYEMAQQNS